MLEFSSMVLPAPSPYPRRPSLSAIYNQTWHGVPSSMHVTPLQVSQTVVKSANSQCTAQFVPAAYLRGCCACRTDAEILGSVWSSTPGSPETQSPQLLWYKSGGCGPVQRQHSSNSPPRNSLKVQHLNSVLFMVALWNRADHFPIISVKPRDSRLRSHVVL